MPIIHTAQLSYEPVGRFRCYIAWSDFYDKLHQRSDHYLKL